MNRNRLEKYWKNGSEKMSSVLYRILYRKQASAGELNDDKYAIDGEQSGAVNQIEVQHSDSPAADVELEMPQALRTNRTDTARPSDKKKPKKISHSRFAVKK